MKNLYLLLVLIFIGCGRKSLPVSDGWVWEKYESGGTVKFDTGYVQVEAFRLGGTDSFYRKVVIDSSWVEIK